MTWATCRPKETHNYWHVSTKRRVFSESYNYIYVHYDQQALVYSGS